MKKQKKGGFTLVEVIIVIAVIAILASILIPTFSSIVRKANISIDIQNAKSMNTALATAEMLDGKNSTFQDVIDDIRKAGLSIDKLTPSAEGNELCWDRESNRVVYFNQDGSANYSDESEFDKTTSDLWKVAHGNDALDRTVGEFTFSYYLANDFTNITALETLNTGVDVGEHTNITTINYSNSAAAQNVIIRTDGGTLIVDAPDDTIKHYEKLQYLDIIEVADTSFEEYGTTELARIEKGRYNIVNAPQVPKIFIASNEAIVASKGDAELDIAGRNSSVTEFLFQLVENVETSETTNIKVVIDTNGEEPVLVYKNEDDSDINADDVPQIIKEKNIITALLDVDKSIDEVLGEVFAENKIIAFELQNNGEQCDANLYIPFDRGSIALSVANIIFDDENGLKPTTAMKWSSSAPAVATVDDNGSVTFVGAGEASVTVKPVGASDVEKTVNLHLVAITDFSLKFGGIECVDNGELSIYSDSDAQFAIEGYSYNYSGLTDLVLNKDLTYTTIGDVFTITNGILNVNPGKYGNQQVTVAMPSYNISKTFNIKVISPAEVSFESVLPNTDKYLYRVGNENAIQLSRLLKQKEGINFSAYDSTRISIYDASKTSGEGTFQLIGTSGAFNANSNTLSSLSDTIKFTGTGVVIIRIACIKNGNVVEETAYSIALEVVGGKNVTIDTELSGGTNYVLLNDVAISTKIALSNQSLYGNGFEIDAKNAPTGNTSNGTDSSNYVISLTDSTLDNIKIIGRVYTEYGTTVKDDFNYPLVLSASGDNSILNCYLSNTASPVRVNSNGLLITNTTLKGGTFCNLDIRTGKVTLNNVITINQTDGNDKANNGTTPIGLGIVVYYEGNIESVSLVIEGKLTQYNNIGKDEASSLESNYTKSVVNIVFNGEFDNYVFTNNGKEFVNTGILSMNAAFNMEDITGSVANYSSKELPFKVLLADYYGYLYSLNGTNPIIYSPESYVPSEQGITPPSCAWVYPIEYNDVSKQVEISFDDYDSEGNPGSYTIDTTNILSVSKHSNSLPVDVSVNNGAISNNGNITFTADGDYTITFSYTDNYHFDKNGNVESKSIDYDKKLNITVNVIKTKTPAPEFTIKGVDIKPTRVTECEYNVNTVSTPIEVNARVRLKDADGFIDFPDNNTYITVSDGYAVYFPVFYDTKTGTSFIEIRDIVSSTDKTPVIYNKEYAKEPNNFQLNSNGVTEIEQIFVWRLNGTNYPGAGCDLFNNNLYYTSFKWMEGNDSSPGSMTVEYIYAGADGNNYHYWVKYTYHGLTWENTGCLISGTLITLSDGTQVPVENLELSDMIRTFSFETAAISSKNIFAIEEGDSEITDTLLIELSNGKSVTIVAQQSFFEMNERKYFTIDSSNCQEYIGKTIMVENNNHVGCATIVRCTPEIKEVKYYEIITVTDYNFFANNILTCEPFIFNSNIFVVDDELKYDSELMEQDINEYGLFTYEEWSDYLTEAEFEAFGGKYFKVAIGKGIVTYEQIFKAIDTYREAYLG